MFHSAGANNDDEIIGLYALSSSTPEGGAHMFVLENGTYAIAYFGGIRTGQWKKIKDDTFRFTPNTKQSEFELYGRYNRDLGDSLKIFFNGFENCIFAPFFVVFTIILS